MSRDLAAVRAELADRRVRTAMVSAQFDAFNTRVHDGDRIDVIEVRCEDKCRRMLAKVYVVDEGALFVSRIAWLPSDQLTLRPWERDGYLRQDSLQHLEDSELDGWLDYLDTWTHGLDRERSYWKKDGGVAGVRDVLTEPPTPTGWLPDLWVRCRDHPQKVHALNRGDLLTATRRARVSR